MRRLLAAWACLLLMAGTPAAARAVDCDLTRPGLSPGAHRILEAARQLMDQGKFQPAADRLNKFLAQEPDLAHFRLEFTLGLALYHLKQPDQAAARFERALKLKPCFDAAMYNLALVRYEQGNHLAAAQLMLRAYKEGYPSAPERLYLAGIFYLRAGQPAQALPLLKDLASRDQAKDEWLTALVQAYLELKQPEQAERFLEPLLLRRPQRAGLWRLSAQAALARSHYGRAAARLGVAYRLEPPKQHQWRNLGDIYRAAGLPRQAVACYQRAFGPQPRPKDLDLLARTLLQGDLLPQALDLAQQAQAAQPSAARAALVGRILLQQRRYGPALAAFQRAVALGDERGRNSLLEGYAAWHLESLETAMAAFRRALKHAGKDQGTARQARRALAALQAHLRANASADKGS